MTFSKYRVNMTVWHEYAFQRHSAFVPALTPSNCNPKSGQRFQWDQTIIHWSIGSDIKLRTDEIQRFLHCYTCTWMRLKRSCTLIIYPIYIHMILQVNRYGQTWWYIPPDYRVCIISFLPWTNKTKIILNP